MAEVRKFRTSVYNTMSTHEAKGFHIYAEILLRGYALVTCRIPRSPLITVATMGLYSADHPEISVVAKYEEEAVGLLQYLAKQVLERGKRFQAGVHTTTFFEELIFNETDYGMDSLDVVDEGITVARPQWIQCSLPFNPLAPSRGEGDRCRIDAA